jgi:hypothetical protein
MTWHAKAMTTSYVTNQGAGSVGDTEGDVFPTSTTSWYFIDKIDMDAPKGTQLVVALGDSITDGRVRRSMVTIAGPTSLHGVSMPHRAMA